jgi:hypothetical protein
MILQSSSKPTQKYNFYYKKYTTYPNKKGGYASTFIYF